MQTALSLSRLLHPYNFLGLLLYLVFSLYPSLFFLIRALLDDIMNHLVRLFRSCMLLHDSLATPWRSFFLRPSGGISRLRIRPVFSFLCVIFFMAALALFSYENTLLDSNRLIQIDQICSFYSSIIPHTPLKTKFYSTSRYT